MDIAALKVRQLEWYEPTDHPMDMEDSAMLVAAGLGGRYHVSKLQTVGKPYLLWWAHDEFSWTGHDSVEGAKATAQADHEQRILSALEPPAALQNTSL